MKLSKSRLSTRIPTVLVLFVCLRMKTKTFFFFQTKRLHLAQGHACDLGELKL